MAGLSSSQFDAIAKLANTGLCGRDLREAVSQELNIKLSRNQIGGILYRLRASNKVTVRPDKIRVVARRQAAPSHPTKSALNAPVRMPMLRGPEARFAPSPVFNDRETAPLFPTSLPGLTPLAEYGPANMFDLRRDSCRWPLWSDDAQPIEDKFFCNEAQAEPGEGPYCCAHTRAAKNRNYHPASIRNAANVKKTYFE